MTESIPRKQCRDCKEWKPATTEFFNATAAYQSPDCLNKQCKECRNAYRRARNKAEPREPRLQSDTKKCYVCNESFSATLEHFYYSKNTKDRLCTLCKECSNAKSKEYRSRPGAEEYRRAYRMNRAERDRQYHKAYRVEHSEDERQRRKAYYEAHREYDKEYHRAYGRTDKGKAANRARYHKRRALKNALPGAYTTAEVLTLYERQRGHCYYCKSKFHTSKYAYHVDHVIPLSRGGSNDISNIVLACPSCNLRKGKRLPHEWPESSRLL